jgi:hypothetical protein
MAKLASCLVGAENVGAKTRIIQGDIFKEDFGKASVVTMYLLPELNLCVRHRLLAMKPGTRVASHQFTMGDWEADETSEFEYRTAYLWIIPARVEGTWVLREPGGASYTVSLTQTFQKISGDLVTGSGRQPLVGATLRGDQLRFAFTTTRRHAHVQRHGAGHGTGGHAQGQRRRGQGHGSPAGWPARRRVGRDAPSVRALLRKVVRPADSLEPRRGGALHV